MPNKRRVRRPGAEPNLGRSRPSRRDWPRALRVAGVLSALSFLALVLALLIPPGKPLPQGKRTAGGMERVLEQALLDLDQARRKAASGPEAAVWVTVSDADMDEYLAQTFSGRAWPLRLRDPVVAFYSGQVLISAQISVVRVPLRLTAELTPVARQGRVSITAHRLRLGLLPVPGSYRRRLGSELQSAVNSVLYATDMLLEALEIRSGEAAARLRPAAR